MTISQISRAVMDKPVFSKAIREHANTSILWRPTSQEEMEHTFIMSKKREPMDASVDLKIDWFKMTFKESK